MAIRKLAATESALTLCVIGSIVEVAEISASKAMFVTTECAAMLDLGSYPATTLLRCVIHMIEFNC